MENLIYVALVVLYFIFQFSQAKARKKRADQAKQQQTGTTNTNESDDQGPVFNPMSEVEDRMKKIFREIEMKTKPYAQPSRTYSPSKKIQPPVSRPPLKQAQKIQKKKEPTPFLNVDMTQEEVFPEGTPSKMSEDAFEKGKIVSYDYSIGEKRVEKRHFNLREAVIANVILNRPEW